MAEKSNSVVLSSMQMLQAVRTRDANTDHSFVYGVVSTGVYCLPSCPSRAAKEDNLRFFLQADAAEAANFRPCKRCRPRQTLAERNLIESSARAVIDRCDATPSMTRLADELDISEAAARKRFTTWLGISPSALADASSHQALKQALRRGSSVIEAIYEAGYGSTRTAYERRKSLGMTLSSYRAGGEREQIAFAVRTTSYGELLVAATERGVCFCQFGDSAVELRDELAQEFPNADITPSPHATSAEVDTWLNALQAHLDESGPKPDVPLDLRGSIFQIRVWRFLMSLADGATVSYADVASGIKKPKAHRAAASACGANKIAVLVPCHRVLRGDGSLGGYRWGKHRKKALLESESKSNR